MTEDMTTPAERWSLAAVLVCAGIFLAVFAFFEPAQNFALSILEWFRGHGHFGMVLYVIFYTIIVLFLVPAVIFTLGAGFIFGFWWGVLVVLTSMAISAPIAFFIARYAFGERIRQRLKSHPRLKRLSHGLKDDGWKIILLSRLVPGFPFKLSNYFFGLTEVSARSFFVGTIIGVMPFTISNVYIGSVASRLTKLSDREFETWEWALYGLGLIVAVLLTLWIVHLARKAMHRTLGGDQA